MHAAGQRFAWPAGFRRIPDGPWTQAPVDPFARDYDALQHHTWYANLDPTVAEVAGWLGDGGLLVDYSGGTGILQERLLAQPSWPGGVLNADASAKFLRLALEKLGSDPRAAFRLLAFLRGEDRLQTLEEAAPELVPGQADAVVCANAVHLYPDPARAIASWRAVLRPGGRLHVQSGNVDRPERPEGAWTIDATVDAVDRTARQLVGREARHAAHRAVLADARRMAAYDAVRRRYFLPVRPLSAYRGLLEAGGFRVDAVRHRLVPVRLDEWTRFLSVYHEGILPWVGGTEKVDGRPPPEGAVQDRLALLGEALHDAVGGPGFEAEWTYISATRLPG